MIKTHFLSFLNLPLLTEHTNLLNSMSSTVKLAFRRVLRSVCGCFFSPVGASHLTKLHRHPISCLKSLPPVLSASNTLPNH